MTEAEQVADTAAKVTEALKQLQRELLRLALQLIDGMEESVPEAPLNQRVTMLKALIDGVLKLEARMPREEDEGSVIRIEYIDPDGSTHQTPHWAREDSEDESKIQGGGVRTPIRQD
jgi:hypothetical protein